MTAKSILAFYAIVTCCYLSTCMIPDLSDDDTEYEECLDDFCQTWCEGNYCRIDAGLSAWGECLGACSEETGGCACQDIGCDAVNCNDWCVVEKGANSGVCIEFECQCDFEPDAYPDSGMDSGSVTDSGSE